MTIFTKIANLYKIWMKDHPIILQSIQVSALMCVSDTIAQLGIERKQFKHLDWKRIAYFSLVGVIYVGPVLTVWYKQLDDLIPESKGGSFKKMAIDQCLFLPVYLLILIPMLSIYNGNGWEGIKHNMKYNYPEILKRNFQIWPFIQLVNFSVIPLQYQVLYVQSVSVLWNIYLSYKTIHDRYKRKVDD